MDKRAGSISINARIKWYYSSPTGSTAGKVSSDGVIFYFVAS